MAFSIPRWVAELFSSRMSRPARCGTFESTAWKPHQAPSRNPPNLHHHWTSSSFRGHWTRATALKKQTSDPRHRRSPSFTVVQTRLTRVPRLAHRRLGPTLALCGHGRTRGFGADPGGCRSGSLGGELLHGDRPAGGERVEPADRSKSRCPPGERGVKRWSFYLGRLRFQAGTEQQTA